MMLSSRSESVEEGRDKRAQFIIFLNEKGIKYRIGKEEHGVWIDTDILLRAEFYLGGKTISALFSPLAITCCVETSGLYAYTDFPIDHWNSVKELCDHIINQPIILVKAEENESEIQILKEIIMKQDRLIVLKNKGRSLNLVSDELYDEESNLYHDIDILKAKLNQ